MVTTGTTPTKPVYYVEIKDSDEYDMWRRWCNVLSVYYNGKLIAQQSDGGEPEDNSFYRDYDWVAIELENAFELGVLEGRKQMVKALEDQLNDKI